MIANDEEGLFATLMRDDGRPEAYDVPTGFLGKCVFCVQEGHTSNMEKGKIVMCSPIDASDLTPHLVCVEKHVPDDVVIFDPETNWSRDKTGQNVWCEVPGGPKVPLPEINT